MGKLLLAAAALALAPAAALAQETPPAGSAPPADSVGPRELQNFSLSGTVTRPSDQSVPVQATPQKRQPRSEAQSPSAPTQRAAAPTETGARRSSPALSAPQHAESASAEPGRAQQPRQQAAEPVRQSASSASVTVALPKLGPASGTGKATATPASAPAFAPDPPTTGTLAPEHKLSLLPWLLAAIALGAGGAFLFWRNRQRAAFAGPQFDLFTAPEPVPAPQPAPAPAPTPPAPRSPPASIPGVVSTRLRPWIDIGFQPVRCVLEDNRVTVDFEIELFNSGSAPARAVLVEAILINAGPRQDSEIASFFGNPVGEGERIVVIPPLKRVSLRTQVAAPREQMQAYELGGHQVFVPLIAFNALYRWSGGEGQTSASYLIGRDTKGEKMGPFRLDLGPHIFRGVAARPLPAAVRS